MVGLQARWWPWCVCGAVVVTVIASVMRVYTPRALCGDITNPVHCSVAKLNLAYPFPSLTQPSPVLLKPPQPYPTLPNLNQPYLSLA